MPRTMTIVSLRAYLKAHIYIWCIYKT